MTSSITIAKEQELSLGFHPETRDIEHKLDHAFLMALYQQTPGMVSDKLKVVLEFTWACIHKKMCRGVVFAYDESQNLSDHAAKDEYPLSLLLDVFQSIQKKNIPFMLVLTGLPTLFPKLVEARTFAERMFHVIFLDRLDEEDSREAIRKPIDVANCPVKLHANLIESMIEISGGYPYFIQFLGREVYDVVHQRFAKQSSRSKEPIVVPFDEIVRKLDNDFFAGRWARATDRQRALLTVISHIPHCDGEYSVQEVVQKSKDLLTKPFSPSHVSQMLSSLGDAGLIYKNRHGKYSFAVPLLHRFILRQTDSHLS